jgi:hypothetical protein
MTEPQNALDAGLTLAELVAALPSGDGTSVTGVQVSEKLIMLVVNGDLAQPIMQRVLEFVNGLYQESHAAAPGQAGVASVNGSEASA